MIFLQDGVLTIDNSSLETASCPREFYYRVIQRKHARDRNTSALDAGTAVHSFLDLHYRGETDIEILNGQIVKHIDASPGDWRTPERYIEAMHLYLEYWRNRDFNIFAHHDRTFIELPFAVPLGEIEVHAPFTYADRTYAPGDKIPILYTGRVDLIERDGKDLWAVDHKTASMTGDSYWEHFALAQQTIGYVWAVKQEFPDLNVVGAKLNAIIVRPPSKTGKNFEFDRRKYVYKQDRLDEWHDDVLHQCGTIIHHLQMGYFPKVTSRCVKDRAYGTCEFHGICKTPCKNRAAAEEMILVDNFWSPLNERE